jgi:sensor histidine kinase regulating citrate/malate metabolism
MGNSKIIIAIVVGIVVIKLVAVHFYLKTKIKQSEENQAKTKQRK